MIDQAWLDRAQEDGGCISRLELLHARLTGQDWSELEVRKSSFQGCTFTDCDFTGTAFYECLFSGCCFSACRLPGTFFQDCRIAGSKLDGADLRRVRLRRCALEDTLARYANWNAAVLDQCTLKNCDLTESALSEGRLSKLNFDSVNLTGAELFKTSFRGLDLSRCTLDGVALSASCAELKGAAISAPQAAVVARVLGIRVVP